MIGSAYDQWQCRRSARNCHLDQPGVQSQNSNLGGFRLAHKDGVLEAYPSRVDRRVCCPGVDERPPPSPMIRGLKCSLRVPRLIEVSRSTR